MTESLAAQSRLLAGRYRLGRVLGRGGMGTVWEAHDEMLDRGVAVKEVVPPPELTADQRQVLRRRTLREARAAARINHPGAVTVHDVVEEDGNPFIVMQLLSPRTLADVIAATGPLPPAQAARVGLDLVDALAAAHMAGVLHRDVKPANVMLTDTGRAVLTDFGIATVEEDPTLTSTGMLMGSPAYMAPERARGERPSPASDLWSLGATLFTAVQGDSPFRREGNLPTLNAVLTEAAPPATRAGALAPVIAALLSRDPADRPDAARTRQLLHDAEHEAEHEAERPPAAVQVPTAVVDRRVEPTMVTVPAVAAAPAAAPPTVTRTVEPPAQPPAQPPAEPAAGPPAAGSPGSMPSRRRRSGLLVAAVLAVMVAAAALLALVRDPSHSAGSAAGPVAATSGATTAATTPTASGAASASASAPAGSSPASSGQGASSTGATSGSGSSTSGGSGDGGTSGGSGGGGTRAVPAGYQPYADPSGFSLFIPAGWNVSHRGTTLYVQQPGGRAYLQVPQTSQPKADALADWKQQSAYGASHFNQYKLLRLERVSYRKGWDCADWEFLWTASGGQLHVLDRNVRVSDRRAYALYWSVPAQDWPQRQRDFEVMAASFRSAGS